MTIINCKPTSPGVRHLIKVINKKLYKGKLNKSLLSKKKKTGGRNNLGRITTRHKGGGHKKHYRIIDFKRNYDNIIGKVERLEYDPNRSCNIALILYKNGIRKYILAMKDIKIGDKIESGENVNIKLGNTLPICNIPIGSIIHNIELKPGKGGQLARAAGTYAQIISSDKKYVNIRLRSGEIRKIFMNCRATLGSVSFSKHMLYLLGKAGKSRWKGIRPTVRGTAMNPIDHPHGGGEGRNFGKHPVTPWGIQTKGKKTRTNKRTNKFIINLNNKKK
ncbi:50S ribosomal protein L2 [Enterobacterales bacterium endosymbiont of Anomoneura mori]|uniref:50S ribosomal protein L2 n=1 Tax=Enterobacterales bacterium endosymbiont of Anomoneura mori TaxID=3132096 RepID=UPI00399CAD9F